MEMNQNEMQELTNEELMQIDGGRSLWYEVGYVLGWINGALRCEDGVNLFL